MQATKTFDDVGEAKAYFQQVKQRFLDVNNWHEIAGKLTADFQLIDDAGKEVNRQVQVRDYFKIDIPGPGNKAGEGFDWVQVERIEEKDDEAADCESIIITVRPAPNPSTPAEDIAHFFSDDATSNFTLMRQGNTVTGGVHGRNEIPNTASTSNLVDKARNAIIGTTAVAGLSNAQWSSLVNGWLNK